MSERPKRENRPQEGDTEEMPEIMESGERTKSDIPAVSESKPRVEPMLPPPSEESSEDVAAFIHRKNINQAKTFEDLADAAIIANMKKSDGQPYKKSEILNIINAYAVAEKLEDIRHLVPETMGFRDRLETMIDEGVTIADKPEQRWVEPPIDATAPLRKNPIDEEDMDTTIPETNRPSLMDIFNKWIKKGITKEKE